MGDFLDSYPLFFLVLNPDALSAQLSPCWCSASVEVYKNYQQSSASLSEEGFGLDTKMIYSKFNAGFLQ